MRMPSTDSIAKNALRASRTIAVGVLAFALLAPFLWGIPLETAGLDCSASCCKNGQHCCRRSKTSASEMGPGWRAAPGCLKGCGPQPGRLRPTAVGAGLACFDPAPVTAPLEARSFAFSLGASAEFPRFARPPPSF